MINEPIKIKEDCQFMLDLEADSNRAIFNLICSKRDVAIWAKCGMKINSAWKISDVKKYFGMNGRKEVLVEKLNKLYEVLTAKENK